MPFSGQSVWVSLLQFSSAVSHLEVITLTCSQYLVSSGYHVYKLCGFLFSFLVSPLFFPFPDVAFLNFFVVSSDKSIAIEYGCICPLLTLNPLILNPASKFMSAFRSCNSTLYMTGTLGLFPTSAVYIMQKSS